MRRMLTVRLERVDFQGTLERGSNSLHFEFLLFNVPGHGTSAAFGNEMTIYADEGGLVVDISIVYPYLIQVTSRYAHLACEQDLDGRFRGFAEARGRVFDISCAWSDGRRRLFPRLGKH